MKITYDFPYPILKNDSSSSYNDKCTFEIFDIGESDFDKNEFIINIQNSLCCNTIELYLKEKKCNLYIGYSTENSRKLVKINDFLSKYDLRIPVGELKSIDTINVFSYIIAEENIDLNYSDEMDPVYDVGESLLITKKDILAISNSLEFFYNRTGETIIQFNEVKEESFKDFQIDLLNDDFINIKISHSFNEGYAKINQDVKRKSIMGILNASIVHLVFVYTLSNLASNGYEAHLNKRWFKVMAQVFSSRNIDIKKELKDMKDKIDIDKIYDYSQRFMNHYFEQSIVMAGKEVS